MISTAPQLKTTAEDRRRQACATDESKSCWYKDAIIYQLHVRTFRDSNHDGIGDFRGLTQSLDYIQDLGVTAVWLLPFFPSPLKDDGYDIADYENIHPNYGTLHEFQEFLEEAHRRELRVITELVLNHTSDQHAWFQRSRRAPAGSDWRDWYVWSDTPDKYQEARIIFQDFETSNWSWDPVAGAYFWHRFYNHQPDLNFDNPAVREAMLATVDFWFEMGVDGLRLDAVPYLFEREGTNCENLPETHAFLREVRSRIDQKFNDRMLLAEANQWPEDAAAYFGAGDECHMNFHFPLMPRLYMAVEREDRWPIVDIIEQTPIVPTDCQWAIFLRNHDELTLEMVTDEERDYMYRTYAVDAKARINLGIRRRLAPLMANNRRKIELMNGLLLSLPGTPVVYYGDEIGMGDNYYLGDRNGVRTPMQWNSDRNAGFSRANPQSLDLPVIIDPEYHFEVCNVEVQQANPHSLLGWMRRTLDVRKQYAAFGHGSFEAISGNNAKVLAYLRETELQTLLVVANLSRFPQSAELDLSRFHGRVPRELFGEADFPMIGEQPYLLSLGAHDFFWFSLESPHISGADTPPRDLPICQIRGGLPDLLQGMPLRQLGEALETYVRIHRWFAGKARALQAVFVNDAFSLDSPESELPSYLLLVTATYAEGESELYALPVTLLDDHAAGQLLTEHPAAGILRVKSSTIADSTLVEATFSDPMWRQLVKTIAEKGRIAGRQGALVGSQTHAFPQLWNDELLSSRYRVHAGEQSNTSTRIGDSLILKLFRRVAPGLNPDYEIGRQLTEREQLPHVPRVGGALEYQTATGATRTVAILHEFVENSGDAWVYTLEELARYYERVPVHVSLDSTTDIASVTTQELQFLSGPMASGSTLEGDAMNSPLRVLGTEPPAHVQETVGPYLSAAELLARRTAELHLALAHTDGGPAFAPEPFTWLYQRGLYQSMRGQAKATFDLLRPRIRRLPEESQEQANQLLGKEAKVLDVFGGLLRQRIHAQRIRCHGDYHLGQVLFTGKDFSIIDFEGEPDRPVSERRIKTSPLRDVAGMLRSFHYASHAALRAQGTLLSSHGMSRGQQWAATWHTWTSATFLRAYLEHAQPGGFLPNSDPAFRTLLVVYLLEKALYELRYELNNRPDWVAIPLEGIIQLLE